MIKNKKVLGIVLAGAMVVMCAVPVQAASITMEFDSSAYSFGVINRTGVTGVYSAWLAGANAGAVTKAQFSVGNGSNLTSIKGKTKLNYGDNRYREVSFNSLDSMSSITLYGNGEKTAIASK